MRKATAIFFLIIYLCSTTESYQFLKIPLVFKHYAEHLAENRDTSLITFIDKHFIHGHERDGDYEKDMQLPFKKSCKHLLAAISVYTPMLKPCMAKAIEVSEPIQQNTLIREEHLISSYLASIWQPPKFC